MQNETLVISSQLFDLLPNKEGIMDKEQNFSPNVQVERQKSFNFFHKITDSNFPKRSSGNFENRMFCDPINFSSFSSAMNSATTSRPTYLPSDISSLPYNLIHEKIQLRKDDPQANFSCDMSMTTCAELYSRKPASTDSTTSKYSEQERLQFIPFSTGQGFENSKELNKQDCEKKECIHKIKLESEKILINEQPDDNCEQQSKERSKEKKNRQVKIQKIEIYTPSNFYADIGEEYRQLKAKEIAEKKMREANESSSAIPSDEPQQTESTHSQSHSPVSLMPRTISSPTTASVSSDIDSLLEENIEHWNPDPRFQDRFIPDCDYLCDGKKQSSMAQHKRTEMLLRWQNEDVQRSLLGDGREDAGSVGANIVINAKNGKRDKGIEEIEDGVTKEFKGSNVGNATSTNKTKGDILEHSEDYLSFDKASDINQPNCNESNSSAEIKIMKRRRTVVKNQIREAKQHWKLFGEWVRKPWIKDNDERLMWDEAEAKLCSRDEGEVKEGNEKDARATTLEELKDLLKNEEVLNLTGEQLEALKMKIQQYEKKREKEEKKMEMSDFERYWEEKEKNAGIEESKGNFIHSEKTNENGSDTKNTSDFCFSTTRNKDSYFNDQIKKDEKSGGIYSSKEGTHEPSFTSLSPSSVGLHRDVMHPLTSSNPLLFLHHSQSAQAPSEIKFQENSSFPRECGAFLSSFAFHSPSRQLLHYQNSSPFVHTSFNPSFQLRNERPYFQQSSKFHIKNSLLQTNQLLSPEQTLQEQKQNDKSRVPLQPSQKIFQVNKDVNQSTEFPSFAHYFQSLFNLNPTSCYDENSQNPASVLHLLPAEASQFPDVGKIHITIDPAEWFTRYADSVFHPRKLSRMKKKGIDVKNYIDNAHMFLTESIKEKVIVRPFCICTGKNKKSLCMKFPFRKRLTTQIFQ